MYLNISVICQDRMAIRICPEEVVLVLILLIVPDAKNVPFEMQIMFDDDSPYINMNVKNIHILVGDIIVLALSLALWGSSSSPPAKSLVPALAAT